jgi:hypothetical protein
MSPSSPLKGFSGCGSERPPLYVGDRSTSFVDA